jgi:putative Mg2+ transporter-C (MgtC) family protein
MHRRPHAGGTSAAGCHTMDLLLDELADGLPDAAQTIRLTVRIVVAAMVGAVIGFERQQTGKSAGLRTHMLVSLGAAVMVIAPLESGMRLDEVSRVVQGVATGIGFLGAGAILKRSQSREVWGLTTAAGIWVTAAAGVAAGLGRYGVALISIGLAWVILAVISRLEGTDGDGGKSMRP